MILRGPNVDVAQLEIGRPTNRPTGNAKSVAPHSASFKPSFFCISGIRDDQVAVIIPDRKKNTPVTHLALVFVTSVSNMRKSKRYHYTIEANDIELCLPVSPPAFLLISFYIFSDYITSCEKRRCSVSVGSVQKPG